MTTALIEIKNLVFNPNIITITKGTTVIWTNNDTVTHTVTSDAVPPIFDSDPIDIPAGQQFQYTFNTVGTFNYHCEIHTTMHGTIIVKEESQTGILVLAGLTIIGLYILFGSKYG